jgi:hypothetical protein
MFLVPYSPITFTTMRATLEQYGDLVGDIMWQKQVSDIPEEIFEKIKSACKLVTDGIMAAHNLTDPKDIKRLPKDTELDEVAHSAYLKVKEIFSRIPYLDTTE